MINCMIAGVGGQGTVLASKLIAASVLKKGCDVLTTETIGMAQRGGSVFSHIRINDEKDEKDENSINSPLIPLSGADIIIAFEPSEAVRIVPYLNKNNKTSLMIVCDNAVYPITGGYDKKAMLDYLKANVKNLIIMDIEYIKNNVKNIKALNTVLLGAAAESGIFPFDTSDMEKTIIENLPQKFHALNIEALRTGKEMFIKYENRTD